MKYIFIFIALFSTAAYSQSNVDSIKVKTSLTLAGKRVTAIRNDTTTRATDSIELITKAAARKMASSYEPNITAPNSIKRYWTGYKIFASLNSDSLVEGSTNQFFTNARSRGAISLTTIGSSGGATYNSSTGVLNVPNYATSGSGLIGSGIVNSSVVPFTVWNVSNSKLSSTSTYLTYDTINGKVLFNSSVTATSGKALGTIITDTLKAVANNDTLVALEVTPIFTSNSRTGLTTAALRYGGGNVVERGALLPASYGSTDIILKQGTQIISSNSVNNSYYNYIKLQNGSGGISIGGALGSGGNGSINLTNPNGTASLDGSGTFSFNTPILMNISSTDSKPIWGYNNGSGGYFYPFRGNQFGGTGSWVTSLGNAFNTGIINFTTSQGTSGNQIEAMRINTSGRVGMGTTLVDDGVNQLQVNGSTKATQYRLAALNTAPASSTDTGTTGEIRVTSTYIYTYIIIIIKRGNDSI
jgi:hypothetical protein